MSVGYDMFSTQTADDGMDMADHSGLQAQNAAASGMASGSATRSLVIAWVFFLAVYWALANLFSRQLS